MVPLLVIIFLLPCQPDFVRLKLPAIFLIVNGNTGPCAFAQPTRVTFVVRLAKNAKLPLIKLTFDQQVIVVDGLFKLRPIWRLVIGNLGLKFWRGKLESVGLIVTEIGF